MIDNSNFTYAMIDTDRYVRLAFAEMYNDYRFMFMASCLTILCAIEVGKALARCESASEFFREAWTFSAYIVMYLLYGVWTLFHIASQINAG